jgi:hypothetical protein
LFSQGKNSDGKKPKMIFDFAYLLSPQRYKFTERKKSSVPYKQPTQLFNLSGG